MSKHPSALAGKAIAVAILMVWLVEATLLGESQLQVVSPENGAVVNAGGALMVTIKAPHSTFQSISLAGDGPFALSTSLTAPPYQFSYLIPGDFASGRYRFIATGKTASGETVCSDAVEVDVERSDDVKKLESEYQSLTLGDQKDAPLQIWGTFQDGTRVDVTRSKRMVYTSDRPAIAAVSNEGAVSAVGAGKARITARYGDKALVVPVVITQGPKK